MRPLLIAIFVIIITLSIAATPNAHIPVAVMDDSMPTMLPPLDKESLAIGIGSRTGPGFESDGSWQAENLRVTADGRFTGVFKLRYDRQTVSIENTQDVLFIQPVATYIMSPSRDTMLRSVGNFVAVLAQERNDSSVTFVVDAPFTYPEPWLGEYGDRDAPLGGFEMVMIWYRVYRSLIGARGSVPLEVHANIYPGEPNVFRYEFVTLDIDAPPQSASGQLTYAGGGYDAFGRWISENIKPPTIYLPYMLSSYN